MTATAERRRGPYAKTRGRVEAVQQVAHDLVVEMGHRCLTLAEVARRCDLTEAQLLYHFPSRDHLLVGALEHADRESESHAARAPGDAPQDLLAALSAAVDHDLAQPAVRRLFVSMCAEGTDPDHPAHAWVRHRGQRIIDRYVELAIRLQAEGRAAPDVDPTRFARQFMAVWDGLQAQWLVDPSFDLGREVGMAFRTLLEEHPPPALAPLASVHRP